MVESGTPGVILTSRSISQSSKCCKKTWTVVAPEISETQEWSTRVDATEHARVFARGTAANTAGASCSTQRPWIQESTQKSVLFPSPTTIMVAARKTARVALSDEHGRSNQVLESSTCRIESQRSLRASPNLEV